MKSEGFGIEMSRCRACHIRAGSYITDNAATGRLASHHTQATLRLLPRQDLPKYTNNIHAANGSCGVCPCSGLNHFLFRRNNNFICFLKKWRHSSTVASRRRVFMPLFVTVQPVWTKFLERREYYCQRVALRS